MSAYGPGTACLRSFESKCRAVSATRRKAFEEATAALDVVTESPPQHAEGPLATTLARPDPRVEQNSSFGISLASETASKRLSTRTATSRGGVRQRWEGALAGMRLAPVTSPNRTFVGTPPKQPHDRFPLPRRATTLARGISSRAAAAADACISGPIDDVGVSASSSLRSSARQPSSPCPPATPARHGDAPYRAPSIRTVLQDFAGIGDVECHPSSVEQVLARRKRRRRANFGVTSALLFSASAEELPLPQVPRPGPLETPEDEEPSRIATGLGLCDERTSLDLSLGGWKSIVASGFRRELEGTIEQLEPFDGATGTPRALDADQIPSSEHGMGGNWHDNYCDCSAVSTTARCDHREGTPSGQLDEVTSKQVGVDTVSCGGVGCAQGNEPLPRAGTKPGELLAPNAAAGMPSFDFAQDIPPSPLPSPPVPLSPTPRRGTSIVRRRPPSRVLSVSGSTLLQHSRDDSHARGAQDSKPSDSSCAEEVLTLGMGDEATLAVSRTAKHQATGWEERASPPSSQEPVSERHVRESIGGVLEGFTRQTSQTGGGNSPQPRLRGRVRPPETAVLLQDTVAPATVGVPQKVHCQRGASMYSPTSPSSTKPAPRDSDEENPPSLGAGRCLDAKAETNGKALHATAYDSSDMAVSRSSSKATPHQATPAHLSKTTAELTIQRWLRRAILRRQGTPRSERGTAQRTGELHEPRITQKHLPAESPTSAAWHCLREPLLEDALHACAGASPRESGPVGQQEVVTLLPAEAATLSNDVVLPYREYDPTRDRSRAFPRNSLVVTSADLDSFPEKLPVSPSPAVANIDSVRHCPMNEQGSAASKSAAQRRRSDTRKNGGTTEPASLAAQEKTPVRYRAPRRPPSTVLFSVPAPPDDRLEPNEEQGGREKSGSTLDGPTSGGARDRNSSRRVQGHGARSSSSVSDQRLVIARDVPSVSVEALGKRFEPTDVRCKAEAWYRLTVQEARLRPSSSSSSRCFTSSLFVDGANDRKFCRPDAVVVTTVAEIAVVESASHHCPRQGDRPSFVAPFTRQVKIDRDEDMGGNPLLHAWGVGNPLLATMSRKITGTSKGAGAPWG